MRTAYDVAIVGSGPAGLTAGLYCGRARLKTLILERDNLGGTVVNIEKIENWPGVTEDGIEGSELAGNMLGQVMEYDDVVLEGGAELKELVLLDNGLKLIRTEDAEYTAKAVIIAGGTVPKKLPIKGLEEFSGNGVYYCVLCDGDQFTGKSIAIIGGGDSGVTGALYMARLGCDITLIEATPDLNATQILCGQLTENKDVKICCSTFADSIEADGKKRVLKMKHTATSDITSVTVDGIFMLAGRDPYTENFKHLLELDDAGFIKVTPRMETSVPGIYAAGDIRSESAMQVITAAGDGATAAIAAEHYINSNNF